MTKKLIFSLLFFACLTPSLFAQMPIKEQLAIGARVGATGSFTTFSPQVDTKLKFGMQGGAVCRYIGEKIFGVQAEVNYSQRGWTDKAADYSYSRTLHYVEIPFMTHLWFGKKRVRGFVNLGPEIAFLVGESVKSSAETGLPHHEKISKFFDYGICAGAGIEFHTRAGIYQLDARYNFGLADIFPNSAEDNFRKSSNQNFEVCLGVLFDVMKR